MRRYSIRDYASEYIGRKLSLCDWCDILLDIATPNITSLSRVAFDGLVARYDTYRSIKNVSNSTKNIMLDIYINGNRKRSLRDFA